MIRIFSVLIILAIATQANLAKAGDYPQDPNCQKGEDCTPPGQDPGQGPGQDPGQGPQNPLPPLGPQAGLCTGLFEGFYANDPAPVTFNIKQTGPMGELHVTAWQRGSMWYGQGNCRQVGPGQASIELYFPNAPVQRGVVNADAEYAIIDGQIDNGPAFHLRRSR